METPLPPYLFLIRKFFSPQISKSLLKKKIQSICHDLLNEIDKFKIADTGKRLDHHFQDLNLNKFREIQSQGEVFNPWTIMVYLITSDPCRRLLINRYEILSFQEIIKEIKWLKEREPNITWTDLGYSPRGMGCYKALRMDLEDGSLFIQMDGGPNGYEKEDNWKRYSKQKIREEDHISFSKFISISHL